jgi:oxygen-independent coproporphyrinogen-3 oxidase
MGLISAGPLSLYIHIPFCKKRCAYCDFNTYAGAEHLIDDFTTALVKEINFVGKTSPKQELATIFFGGGTPSLLSIQQFETIFDAIRSNFSITPQAEISLEANPGTTEESYFLGLIKVGFNRISFGVQSSDPGMLRFLDRIHDFQDVIDSYQNARKAGFENINLDLIFGIPGQTMQVWQSTLADCLALYPEHISAYALGIEEGTPLDKWYSKGLIPEIDQDLAADQFTYAIETLKTLGYDHYEISNWCKPSLQCQHNLSYWRNGNYLALGPGAHGHYNGLRYENVKSIPAYIKSLMKEDLKEFPYPCTPSVLNFKPNTPAEELEDSIMCGLRLVREGLNIPELEKQFEIDFKSMFRTQIDKLQKNGLLKIDNNVLRLSNQGILLGNQVFLEFINER